MNRNRLNVIMDEYFGKFVPTHIGVDMVERQNDGDDNDEEIKKETLRDLLSPQSISQYENFLPLCHPDDTHTWLEIGCSLIDIVPNPNELYNISDQCLKRKEKYIINCEIDSNSDNVVIQKIKIVFHHDANDEMLIRGLYHAYAMRDFAKTYQEFDFEKFKSMDDFEKRMYIISRSHDFVDIHFNSFFSAFNGSEWDLEGAQIEPGNGFRISVDNEN